MWSKHLTASGWAPVADHFEITHEGVLFRLHHQEGRQVLITWEDVQEGEDPSTAFYGEIPDEASLKLVARLVLDTGFDERGPDSPGKRWLQANGWTPSPAHHLDLICEVDGARYEVTEVDQNSFMFYRLEPKAGIFHGNVRTAGDMQALIPLLMGAPSKPDHRT